MAQPRFNTGAVLIAQRFFDGGGRAFVPGDLFPREELTDYTDRRIMQMMDSRHIGPLTRESYAAALQIHGPDFVGKGFTRDGLIAMKIIDDPAGGEGVAPAAAPPPPAKPPEGAWRPAEADYTVSELYRETIWLAGAKRGVATRFDIFDLRGNRLNPGKTANGIAQAQKEADKIIETAAAAPPARTVDDAANAPLFSDYPLALADWTAEQVQAFDDWYIALPVDETAHVVAPAGIERANFLNTFVLKTDDELRQMLVDAGLEPTGEEERPDLLDLVKMLPSTDAADSDTPADDDQKEDGDDGHVQPGATDSEGSSPPAAG